jgi:glycosyltransferase involved in cell wall biosynthesis
MTNKIILATCYAVNPYKGSEDGMGWNFVLQIARHNSVFAITRKNNQPHIEKYMTENTNEIYKNITFLYFDLPYWMRFWKKGGRGAMLYYYMWQKGIVSFVKKQKLNFDIVHNVNFHNDWTPTFLYQLNKPLVWGPIGHHPRIPKQYFQKYDKKYFFIDTITWWIKNLFWKYSFSLKKTIQKTNHILCMNSGVANVIHLKNKSHSIMPSVATDDYFHGEIIKKKDFIVISVGRFVPLKGFDLTILAFANFINQLSEKEKEKCKLILIGSGPEKKNYEQLIQLNSIQNNVEIIEWIHREELMNQYKKASVFLFPSHEGAGMVVAEALSFGLPVVCLKNEGPGEFVSDKCGFTVKHQDYKQTISKLAKSVVILFKDERILLKMSQNARDHYMKNFTWNSKGNQLNEIYKKL